MRTLFSRKSIRRYVVEGKVAFRLPTTNREEKLPEHMVAHLKWLIKEAHMANPWQDQNDHTGKPIKGLAFVVGPTYQQDNISGNKPSVWFWLSSESPSLRKNQVFAYERYLERLGETLQRIAPEGYRVRTAFTVSSCLEQ